MHVRFVGIVAGFLALATRGHAQRVVSSVDLSGTGVWYADSVRSTGASISPAFRVEWPRATLGTSMNVARLDNGGVSVQGIMSPSLFTPSAGGFTGEMAAALGGSSHRDGTHTGQMLGLARLYFMGDSIGSWVGAGVGRTWDGVTWRHMHQTEFAAWLERSNVTTLATVTPVVVQDTLSYTDFQASLRYPMSTLELGLTVGARSGSVGEAVGGTSRVWGNVSAVRWLNDGLAIVGSAGTYPVDLTQGYPGGRFVSLAVRIASRNARPKETRVTTDRDSPTEMDGGRTAGAAPFEVRTVTRGQSAVGRELRVYAPSARSVEINADFTQWRPVPLARGADGWWTVARSIAPGTYQMNVRINGGVWLAPAGLVTSRDEFGGVVGILTLQ